ncbi:MAG TPA: hypothetical protein VK789_27920 [Bryobacteraceae bacterium]|jgi:hypothetical protein|nr:hypothetical protein [Bryobacteraceae bacterium]
MTSETNWIQTYSSGLTQNALSAAIFSGQILYFERLTPMVEAVAELQELLRAAFEPHAPVSAHEFLSKDEYQIRFDRAQHEFRSSSSIKGHIYEALAAAGSDLPGTFCDRLRLRASPPQNYNSDRSFFRSSTPVHRDSWGSAILSQINWWFPVFPLHRDRTLAIYPAHWTTGVANNAQGWDWKRAGKDACTPRLPTAQVPIDDSGEIRITAAPGTLAAFSAAHLHGGVLNTTPLTRFSVETRTINLDDLLAKRGAPNVDGVGERPGYPWFRRMTDGKPLADFVLG